MPQLIRYHYGTFTHEAGEVVDMKWEELPNHTRRGWRDTVLKRVTLMVQLQACDWATLSGKIDALSEAYSVNEKRFWISDENGADTRHVLDPADVNSIRGPRVTCFELPTNQMEQLVCQRDFVITIEMLYEACENEIIEYQESISNIGGSQAWRSQRIINGVPRRYTIWDNSNVTIIQEGHSIGFHGWYVDGAVPTPFITDPTYEHRDKRVIRPTSPLHYGYSWLYYALEWRFEFEIPSAGASIIAPQFNQPLYTNSYYVPRTWVPNITPYP
jgi:hypothetical protein